MTYEEKQARWDKSHVPEGWYFDWGEMRSEDRVMYKHPESDWRVWLDTSKAKWYVGFHHKDDKTGKDSLTAWGQFDSAKHAFRIAVQESKEV